MQDKILYRQVFNSYYCQENRDRSQISETLAEQFDGTHVIFDPISLFKDEESFKKNIKNPLFFVTQSTTTVVVEEKGDKVSFKVFQKNFSRRPGKFYFTLKRNMRFITVNKKTENIYFGEMTNYQNKKKVIKKIMCNSFLEESFRAFKIRLRNDLTQYQVDENSQIVIDASRIFMDKLDGGIQGLTIPSRLLKYYLDKKNIKYPNNFPIYSKFITKDFRLLLKKMDNKIVDAFMSQNNIHGKKIKKVLHTVQDINIENYKTGIKLFGTDWINQDEELLRNILNNKVQFNLEKFVIEQFNKHSSSKEKKKAFLVYKSFNNLNEIDGWTLRDHFRFYVNLKRYGDTEVEWKSDGLDYKKLNREHLDWVDKLTFYKKGNYQRLYPKIFFDSIKNFEESGLSYFPTLLSNTNDYNEESSIQSNCVRTYIGYPSSFIISLRRGEENSLDRLTVEYRIVYLKNSDIVHLDRVQTRAKYNQAADENWDKSLEILDGMVNNIIKDKKFETYQLTKKCVNGVELKSDTHFDENGKLVWSYQAIDDEMNLPMIF